MKRSIWLVFLLIFLVSCRGTIQVVPTASQLPQASPSSTDLPLVEMIVAPTMVPDPTSTLQTRLPPEDWRDWPVVPSVTAGAIQIYQRGQVLGLDPHAFSKVGDCQSVKAAFMGYFDDPTRYDLRPYTYLQDTIDNFKGHFNTDGQAVRGGANAAWELSPLWADPHACLPGENPLQCELRITRPIIVIVRMEIWWDGRTTAQYEKLMRQILDTIIAHGAVPILATKADNKEGDNSINLTTAKLADEYDIPLWNFWAAVQSLPAHGMETNPPNNDNFHISTSTWTTQSFTALEALDSVWKGLLKAGPSALTTPTLIPSSTPGALATIISSPHPLATQETDTTSTGGSGTIVFGLEQREGEGYDNLGVYELNLDASLTRQIFGADIQYQDTSPDGNYMLVNQGANLYCTNVDGTDPVLITRSLFFSGEHAAIWMRDDLIAAILVDGSGVGITLFTPTGTKISSLTNLGASPIEIFPGSTSTNIYWEDGTCTALDVCKSNSIWVSNPTGGFPTKLAGLAGPQLAPDGKTLVASDASPSELSTLIFSDQDGSNQRQYHLPGTQLLDYAWDPSSSKVAAVVALVDSYSGKTSGYRNFLVDPRTLAISEYSPSTFLHPLLLWSPDGNYLFWIGTLATKSGFTISGSLVDISTKRVTDMGTAFGQSSLDYLVITNADWLPVQ